MEWFLPVSRRQGGLSKSISLSLSAFGMAGSCRSVYWDHAAVLRQVGLLS